VEMPELDSSCGGRTCPWGFS